VKVSNHQHLALFVLYQKSRVGEERLDSDDGDSPPYGKELGN